MVAVMVAVNQMRDGLIRHFSNGLKDVFTNRRWGINHNDPLAGGQKYHVVGTLGDPVETVTDLFNQVAFGRVYGGAKGRSGNW